jgi:hypothetical protein
MWPVWSCRKVQLFSVVTYECVAIQCGQCGHVGRCRCSVWSCSAVQCGDIPVCGWLCSTVAMIMHCGAVLLPWLYTVVLCDVLLPWSCTVVLYCCHGHVLWCCTDVRVMHCDDVLLPRVAL